MHSAHVAPSELTRRALKLEAHSVRVAPSEFIYRTNSDSAITFMAACCAIIRTVKHRAIVIFWLERRSIFGVTGGSSRQYRAVLAEN